MSVQEPDFKQLFESAPGLYLVLSPDFRIIAVSDNYLRATMVERKNVLGKSLFEVFPDNPDDATATGTKLLRASLERVLEKKVVDVMAIQKYDIRKPASEGGEYEVRYWSPANTPVFDDSQNIKYIIHKAEDVTEFVRLRQTGIEQNKANQELKLEKDHLEKVRQSQRMEAMGQLAGGIAHDFNNILATILLSCESSLLKPDTPASVKQNLKDILEGSERAAVLTRQLLAFSRKQVLQPTILNINVVVREIEILLNRLLNEKISFSTDLADGLGNTLIDKGQVEQIILNLVVNARDAMANGGKITISTENVFLDKEMSYGNLEVEPGQYVMLAVSDTGVGMDAPTQARIFEPFFTTKEVGKGTGLGLATVYGIVKQNNGTIWVYSELNKGTVFKIYLPFSDQKVSVIEKTPRPETEVSGRTVLVVEDEALLRRAICTALESAGYKVHSASNGAEAVILIPQISNLDLVITDVVMPVMGGKELQKQIRNLKIDVKILFLSGYTDDVLADHGLSEDNPAFLEKPFHLNTLLAKVQTLFD